jgi:hypothetical protein
VIQRVLMLMLWMCCLSFAQEEKNELGLLLGAEFIPQATTTLNQKLSFGKSIAYSVDYARRLSDQEHRFAPGVPVRCRAESQSGERYNSIS